MVAFTGGDKLKAALDAIAKDLTSASTLEVGFMEDATYPDGTPVAMVAAIQEFGAPARKIPPRPFFRTMIAKESDHWGDDLAGLLKATDGDAAKALGILGMSIEGELRESIVAVDAPALSPITLMLRKMFGNSPEQITGSAVGEAARRVAAGEDAGGVSDKPLVWTGHMLASVTSRVT